MAAGSGLKGLGDLAFDGDGEAKKDFLPAALDIFLAKLVGRGTSSSLLSKLMSPNFLGLGGGGGWQQGLPPQLSAPQDSVVHTLLLSLLEMAF